MASDTAVSRADLLEQWVAAFGQAPPPYLSIPFMSKALAYQAQCKRAGGMSAQTCRALQQIASGKSVKDVPMNPNKVGTHYVREWNGRTYQVAVVNGGYEMDVRIWPSLSAIAKQITGTTWSGPRFFGLTKVRSTAA
ncbi:Protein of unknown function [Cognatiyoonia koreensis]|uniref:DUF2924 domain-containing protein n=1 Tax=Cognatiyoonia koreensis TaxID=364200 RepID=A0A1I0MS32_9RHOB|nr:DUF2924 domain-containing protein [Cognatiyoonia koreensis]SEV91502.1 Protein of unknown function [Cognatiyoonia koreensis]